MMIYGQFVFAGIIVILNLLEIDAHGMLMDPVHRGSAHRQGFKTPENYDDNANWCGGYEAQFVVYGGKCGACGDNYGDVQPRANENGGTYGTGTIVKTYTEGQEFEAVVKVTSSHLGTFQFAVCPLNGTDDFETEECFDKYPVKLADGSDKYSLESEEAGDYRIKLVLPKGLICDHCSFRWHWRTAISWGFCEDGIERIGCGNQETFRTCSDIQIVRPKRSRRNYQTLIRKKPKFSFTSLV